MVLYTPRPSFGRLHRRVSGEDNWELGLRVLGKLKVNVEFGVYGFMQRFQGMCQQVSALTLGQSRRGMWFEV